MKIIDVAVPLGSIFSVYPGNTPYSLEPIERIAKGDGSSVSTLQPSARGGTTVIEGCVPLRMVGADGAPPRVALRKS
jgi:kynurenine formamidase